MLKRRRKTDLRVGLNPAMPVTMRHGSVWFDVSGFGEQRRDFLVDDRDRLVNHPHQMAQAIANQIMLIDQSLPKREALCKPTRIDIVGTTMRRVYELPTFSLLLEQPL